MTKLTPWELLPAPSSRPASDRYVGLLNKPEDFNCMVLASMGLSDEAIQNATGLTFGQIHYRLRKAAPATVGQHLTRRDFRRGRSPLARIIVNQAARFVQRPLTQSLRELPENVAYGQPPAPVDGNGHGHGHAKNGHG